MDSSDVVIVGGGPAGSSCAWRLRERGIPTIVLDAMDFPRTKLCAGWITPRVVQDLEIDLSSYPYGIIGLDRIIIECSGWKKPRRWIIPTRQFSIRRYEFDCWLLRRSGADVRKHRVLCIRKVADGFVIDDRIRCRYLVGAGGTLCPVYDTFFKVLNPRSPLSQVCALEEEFAFAGRDGACRLWFKENGLPGYSWHVPKGDGWVNVGIGALADPLRQTGLSLREEWTRFTRKLADLGLIAGHDHQPGGYVYYIRSKSKIGQIGNCFIIGDAAGLATRDLAEGIGPAVESGIRAAEAIASNQPYSLEGITSHSWPGFVAGCFRSFSRNPWGTMRRRDHKETASL